jgi:hypothetical protein
MGFLRGIQDARLPIQRWAGATQMVSSCWLMRSEIDSRRRKSLSWDAEDFASA